MVRLRSQVRIVPSEARPSGNQTNIQRRYPTTRQDASPRNPRTSAPSALESNEMTSSIRSVETDLDSLPIDSENAYVSILCCSDETESAMPSQQEPIQSKPKIRLQLRSGKHILAYDVRRGSALKESDQRAMNGDPKLDIPVTESSHEAMASSTQDVAPIAVGSRSMHRLLRRRGQQLHSSEADRITSKILPTDTSCHSMEVSFDKFIDADLDVTVDVLGGDDEDSETSSRHESLSNASEMVDVSVVVLDRFEYEENVQSIPELKDTHRARLRPRYRRTTVSSKENDCTSEFEFSAEPSLVAKNSQDTLCSQAETKLPILEQDVLSSVATHQKIAREDIVSFSMDDSCQDESKSISCHIQNQPPMREEDQSDDLCSELSLFPCIRIEEERGEVAGATAENIHPNKSHVKVKRHSRKQEPDTKVHQATVPRQPSSKKRSMDAPISDHVNKKTVLKKVRTASGAQISQQLITLIPFESLPPPIRNHQPHDILFALEGRDRSQYFLALHLLRQWLCHHHEELKYILNDLVPYLLGCMEAIDRNLSRLAFAVFEEFCRVFKGDMVLEDAVVVVSNRFFRYTAESETIFHHKVLYTIALSCPQSLADFLDCFQRFHAKRKRFYLFYIQVVISNLESDKFTPECISAVFDNLKFVVDKEDGIVSNEISLIIGQIIEQTHHHQGVDMIKEHLNSCVKTASLLDVVAFWEAQLQHTNHVVQRIEAPVQIPQTDSWLGGLPSLKEKLQETTKEMTRKILDEVRDQETVYEEGEQHQSNQYTQGKFTSSPKKIMTLLAFDGANTFASADCHHSSMYLGREGVDMFTDVPPGHGNRDVEDDSSSDHRTENTIDDVFAMLDEIKAPERITNIVLGQRFPPAPPFGVKKSSQIPHPSQSYTESQLLMLPTPIQSRSDNPVDELLIREVSRSPQNLLLVAESLTREEARSLDSSVSYENLSQNGKTHPFCDTRPNESPPSPVSNLDSFLKAEPIADGHQSNAQESENHLPLAISVSGGSVSTHDFAQQERDAKDQEASDRDLDSFSRPSDDNIYREHNASFQSDCNIAQEESSPLYECTIEEQNREHSFSNFGAHRDTQGLVSVVSGIQNEESISEDEYDYEPNVLEFSQIHDRSTILGASEYFGRSGFHNSLLLLQGSESRLLGHDMPTGPLQRLGQLESAMNATTTPYDENKEHTYEPIAQSSFEYGSPSFICSRTEELAYPSATSPVGSKQITLPQDAVQFGKGENEFMGITYHTSRHGDALNQDWITGHQSHAYRPYSQPGHLNQESDFLGEAFDGNFLAVDALERDRAIELREDYGNAGDQSDDLPVFSPMSPSLEIAQPITDISTNRGSSALMKVDATRFQPSDLDNNNALGES